MKLTLQTDKITLSVNGRDMTFSEEELTAILENHFAHETSTEENLKNNQVAKTPTEGKWFRVDPLTINQSLFKTKREDVDQEKARKLILKAFRELKKNPYKYGKKYEIMILEKTWSSLRVDELLAYAKKVGDHNADWVEQALEWAQRISNGEPWRDICNKEDMANWYRLVVWTNGEPRFVGGSRKCFDHLAPSDVGDFTCNSYETYNYVVPLVVRATSESIY